VLRQPNAAPVSRIGRYGAALQYGPAWRAISRPRRVTAAGSPAIRVPHKQNMATPIGNTEEPDAPACSRKPRPGSHGSARLGSRCVIDRGMQVRTLPLAPP